MSESIQTILIAPVATESHVYRTKIPIVFVNKEGRIVSDQNRSADKEMLID